MKERTPQKSGFSKSWKSLTSLSDKLQFVEDAKETRETRFPPFSSKNIRRLQAICYCEFSSKTSGGAKKLTQK
jgi:hypothetical protein